MEGAILKDVDVFAVDAGDGEDVVSGVVGVVGWDGDGVGGVSGTFECEGDGGAASGGRCGGEGQGGGDGEESGELHVEFVCFCCCDENVFR